MIILYDEHGKECRFNYPIDARQALDSGLYFAEHPGKAKKNEHFKVQVEDVKEKKAPEILTDTFMPGEEIRRGRKLKNKDE